MEEEEIAALAMEAETLALELGITELQTTATAQPEVQHTQGDIDDSFPLNLTDAPVTERDLEELSIAEEVLRYNVQINEYYTVDYTGTILTANTMGHDLHIVKTISMSRAHNAGEIISIVSLESGENFYEYAGCLIPATSEQVEEVTKRLDEDNKALLEDREPVLVAIKQALTDVHGDNWDLQVREDFGVIIYLHFPELTITNGSISHVMKDLFISLEFTKELNFIEMKGTRTTRTYAEHYTGYMHSHLPGGSGNGSYGNFQSFCLGSSELVALNTEMSLMNYTNYKIIEFELWIYQIQAYAAWESLSGGPYRKISNISEGSGNNRYLSLPNQRRMFSRLVRAISTVPLEFSKVTNKFSISRRKLEEDLTNTILSMDNINSKYIIGKVYQDYIFSDDTPTAINAKREKIIEINKEILEQVDSFIYKGEKVFCSITQIDEVEEDCNIQKVVHPDITDFAKKELEQFANYYFIKNYGK
jgi:hypothetical protein